MSSEESLRKSTNILLTKCYLILSKLVHLTNTDDIHMYVTKLSNNFTYTNIVHNVTTTIRHKINSQNIYECSNFRIFL